MMGSDMRAARIWLAVASDSRPSTVRKCSIAVGFGTRCKGRGFPDPLSCPEGTSFGIVGEPFSNRNEAPKTARSRSVRPDGIARHIQTLTAKLTLVRLLTRSPYPDVA